MSVGPDCSSPDPKYRPRNKPLLIDAKLPLRFTFTTSHENLKPDWTPREGDRASKAGQIVQILPKAAACLVKRRQTKKYK